MSDDRWSIWIDVEGFSSLWPSSSSKALFGLAALTRGIFAIGTECFPRAGDRLFAHQFGDGFIIVSDFHEDNLDRCVAVAVCLMRFVAKHGCLARAAIAEGDCADYSGCWPSEIRALADHDTVSLGDGRMTCSRIMGSAVINAVGVDKANPAKGSVLATEASKDVRIGKTFTRGLKPCEKLITIDWVHCESEWIDRISDKAELEPLPTRALEAAIHAYIKGQPDGPWKDGTLTYNRLPPASV